MPTVGEKIRTLRKRRQMTMVELSKLCGFTQGYISQLERDLAGYSNEGIEKIAKIFSVSPILLQDPSVELERLSDVSEILEALNHLSEDNLCLIYELVHALAEPHAEAA